MRDELGVTRSSPARYPTTTLEIMALPFLTAFGNTLLCWRVRAT
mgnify:CR=1 FL=1